MNFQVSAAEQKFIKQGIEQGIREDGRAFLDLRHLDIKTGVFPMANGSARIRQSFCSTEVLTGVKIEVGKPDVDAPNKGRVEVSVDCGPLFPLVQDNLKIDRLSAHLAQELEGTLAKSKAFDSESFCIIPGEFCWVVYVDVVVMGSFGNLSDLISMSAYCALKNAMIPDVCVVETEDGPDFEIVQDASAAKAIDTRSIPVCVTLSLVGGNILADLSGAEEQCSSAAMAIHMNQDGKICGVQKQGTGSFAPAQLPVVFETAKQIARELFQVVDAEMVRENEMQLQVLNDPNLTVVRDEVTLTRATALENPLET